MAVSGTIGRTEIDVSRLIELAYKRCGIGSYRLTPENVVDAKDALFILMQQLADAAVPLWCLELQFYGLNQGVYQIPMDVGTVDVKNVNVRRLTRFGATLTSSDGGTVAFADDWDIETVFTQSAPDGELVFDYGASGSIPPIVMCGLLAATTGTEYDIRFETSEDGLTWTQIGETTFTSQDNRWNWTQFIGNYVPRYFRVRETGGAIMSFREVFVGGSPQDIPLYRMSRDEYELMPNKAQQNPVTQFWFDRQRDNSDNPPLLHLWPAPNLQDAFYLLTMRRQRAMMDVGALTDTLDIPTRWLEYIISGTAWMCSRQLVDDQAVDEATIGRLNADYITARTIALNAEKDPTPVKLNTNLSAYTR